MPPGALALINTALPVGEDLHPEVVSRYVLDQDTGGAIRGPGRVDIFMGTGGRGRRSRWLNKFYGAALLPIAQIMLWFSFSGLWVLRCLLDL